ncbi:MAG: phospholipase [Anaerolineaceae bacterium]|nr:phospholipase [Anaerolineaceae bacterium]
MTNLHQAQPVLTTGAPLDKAKAAMILVHGRGADARSILGLAGEFDQPDFAYLAPQATGNVWYPNRFLAPIESNEPYLSSALQAVGDVVAHVAQAGIAADKIILLGFSQGACLALEFGARQAQRYGGLVGLSGGLIGPEGTVFEYEGSLEDTPVFLGCSDVDFHIPVERVHETTAALQALGGNVTECIYPNMGHTINQDEIDFVGTMMAELVQPSA